MYRQPWCHVSAYKELDTNVFKPVLRLVFSKLKALVEINALQIGNNIKYFISQ